MTGRSSRNSCSVLRWGLNTSGAHSTEVPAHTSCFSLSPGRAMVMARPLLPPLSQKIRPTPVPTPKQGHSALHLVAPQPSLTRARSFTLAWWPRERLVSVRAGPHRACAASDRRELAVFDAHLLTVRVRRRDPPPSLANDVRHRAGAVRGAISHAFEFGRAPKSELGALGDESA